MNSGERSQLTNHWYVTVGEGDVVTRVFPGMSLGETEAGELSLDGGDALLSLSIGSSDSLVVFVIAGGELDSEDGDFCGKRHLAFDSAAQIKLPNNTLRFAKDVISKPGTDTTELPRAVWRRADAEPKTALAGSVDTAQTPPTPEVQTAQIQTPESHTTELSKNELNTSEPSSPQSDETQILSAATERQSRQKLPEETPGSSKKRQRAIVATAAAGLLCVLIGLIYSGTRTTVTPKQPAPVSRQDPAAEASRQAAVITSVEEVTGAALPETDEIPAKSNPAPESTEEPTIAAPEMTVVIAIPPTELIAGDPGSMPAVTAATPSSKDRPTPEAAAAETAEAEAKAVAAAEAAEAEAKAAAAAKAAEAEAKAVAAAKAAEAEAKAVAAAEAAEAEAKAVAAAEAAEAEAKAAAAAKAAEAEAKAVAAAKAAEAKAKAVAAAKAAEAEARREQEQAQTAIVMYERDLLAAELALAQGRLTQPPENNAYALYQQLVASHPESDEARRGFQKLGAALVNRAFAELAAKRWNDARATLTAAAEAGASPDLVADLSGEVAYQQRLAEAETGRFSALYPEDELVALNRAMPRLSRYAPDGMDMVQIEFTISVAGNVQDVEVLGAPPEQLERVVRESVADWRFEPVLSGTRPIPVRTRVGLEIP